MDELFRPDSVAVVGASRDLTKLGGRVVGNLLRYGYQGEIYPVNPAATSVEGISCVNAIADLPMGVDLAVVAVPTDQAIAAVQEMGPRGVSAVSVLTAGFAEAGHGGQRKEELLLTAARRFGMRICGPNTAGVVNLHDGLVATGSGAFSVAPSLVGSLSIIAQSGGVGLGVLVSKANDRGIGLSKMISTGNECDITTAELIRYLTLDPHTNTIAVYMEGVRNGRDLIDAISDATRRSVPVALLKVGRSRSGALAAKSHTGALAGEARVFRDAVTAAGAILCDEVDDLLDKAQALSAAKRVHGSQRLAVISPSGGLNALAADIIDNTSLELSVLGSSTQRSITDIVPAENPVGNPLDLTPLVSGNMSVHADCIRALASDSEVDAVLVILTTLPQYSELPAQLARAVPPSDKYKVSFVNGAGSRLRAEVTELREMGYAVYDSISASVRALDAASSFGRQQTRLTVADAASGSSRSDQEVVELSDLTIDTAGGRLQDEHLIKLLARYGIDYVPHRVASNLTEAVEASRALDYPVVLKPLSYDLPHKSEAAAVFVNLLDDDQVATAWREGQRRLKEFGLSGSRLMVQRYQEGGVELIVGTHSDPQFGPTVTLGHGGIFAELLGQAVTRLAPLSLATARMMIDDLPGVEMLRQFRGRPPRDVEALARYLSNVSLLGSRIDQVAPGFELDLNPVLLFEEGEGALAVDALLIIKD